MLSGTADLPALAQHAGRVEDFGAGPVTLGGAEIVQAAFELPYRSRQTLLPPGLHPTTPPLLVVLAWRVHDSPWGAFSMVQTRISCRSGVRPRGFVARCIVEGEGAAAGLARGWGLPTADGTVHLERAFDRAQLSATQHGTTVIAVSAVDPEPLNPGDAQFTVTTTLAHTPRGLRLVQVEPEYELQRVERARPRLLACDETACGLSDAPPGSPVAATVSVGTITLPPVRFIARPDVSAFVGTEAV